MNSYYLDLSTISLREFYDTLTPDNLAPSRAILLDQREDRFLTLVAAGVTTLQGLIDALKTHRATERVAGSTGIPPRYLMILRRQALSWQPKPVSLQRFDAPPDLVDALAEIGIGTGYDLYAVATVLQGSSRTPFARSIAGAIAHQASVETLADDLARLLAMVDLTRIPGVGPVFARILIKCDVDSCTALADQAPEQLGARVGAAAVAAGYRGTTITHWDIEFCIRFAGRLVRR